MPRPPEFDRQQALEAALKLFWSQGYTATSLSQLLDAMAIGRSSFYAAFLDKRSLFVEVLELFARRTERLLLDEWDKSESLTAIPRFFEITLFEVPARRASRGCLMVNTILELADVDAELSQLAASHLASIEAAFSRCFAEAAAAGHYQSDQTPEELAEIVMLVNQGIRVASRKGADRPALRRSIDNSMALLGLAA